MSSLKVSDVFCYICRGILIEPVTLPCFHVSCLTCFEQSMQETSHSCPFCRKRISNWLRSVKKSNSLVNRQLWEKIKEQFKEQVYLKLNGEDDGIDQYIQRENPVLVTTSKPGEVAQEFSHLLSQIKYEDERIKKNEELASKKLIEKLQEKEEEDLKLIQKKNLLRMKEDEKLAYLMQEEFNKESFNPRPSTRSSSVKEDKPKIIIGPMDNFAKGLTGSDKVKTQQNSLIIEETDAENLSSRSTSTDSTDSLRLEMNLFKPIKKALTTPPKRYPDGRIKEINLTKVVPLKLTFSNSDSSDRILKEGKNIHSNHSAFAGTNSYQNSEDYFESPSKRLKLSVNKSDTTSLKSVGKENNETSQIDITESTIRKIGDKSRLSAFSGASPCKILGHDEDFETQEYLSANSIIEEKLIEEQMRIEKIILQEKADREFAMKLCQEWEAEDNEKPQTRSVMAATLKKNKVQKTIMESFSSKKNKKL